MPYNDALKNEKAPTRRTLLPEGWRLFKITSGEEATSKAGNSMFIFNVEDSVTKNVDKIYIVRTEGKRWLLKQILEAVGVKKDADDNFTYELSDLIGQDIEGEVKHEPNEFINRSGETIKTTQHKIVAFRHHAKSGNPNGVKSPEEIAWEE